MTAILFILLVVNFLFALGLLSTARRDLIALRRAMARREVQP